MTQIPQNSETEEAYSADDCTSPSYDKPKRPAPLSIRFSAEELAKLQRNAGGMAVSAYIKSVLFADSAPHYRQSPKPPVADKQALVSLAAMLGNSRLANNLNQIAKAIHLGIFPVSPELEQELRFACMAIRDMRLTLLCAMGRKKTRGPL